MLSISEMIMKTLISINKCSTGDKIIIKTYKKDRQIIVHKEEEGCTVMEDGFEEKTFPDVSLDELPKLLKQLKAKEFPRSNKVWFSIQKARR